jgi:hypothetical protein
MHPSNHPINDNNDDGAMCSLTRQDQSDLNFYTSLRTHLCGTVIVDAFVERHFRNATVPFHVRAGNGNGRTFLAS